jgi:hypothetical protein
MDALPIALRRNSGTAPVVVSALPIPSAALALMAMARSAGMAGWRN